MDINAPANTIEYHPALLAHAEDHSAVAAAAAAAAAASKAAMAAQAAQLTSEDAGTDSDDSDLTDEDLSEDSLASDESDLDAIASMSPAEQAEYERFGAEYKGPVLPNSSASRLLVLMLHASTCPGQ